MENLSKVKKINGNDDDDFVEERKRLLGATHHQ